MSKIDDEYWYRLPNVSYASEQHSLAIRTDWGTLFIKLGIRQDECIRDYLEKILSDPTTTVVTR